MFNVHLYVYIFSYLDIIYDSAKLIAAQAPSVQRFGFDCGYDFGYDSGSEKGSGLCRVLRSSAFAVVEIVYDSGSCSCSCCLMKKVMQDDVEQLLG